MIERTYMSSSWHDIWTKKASTHTPDNYTLSELLRLDGYDISVSAVSENEIREFALGLISKLRVGSGDSVFEIGCGAGAMLKIFSDMGLRVSGLDYTADLIEIARAAIPEGNFSVGEAVSMDVPESEKFDACFSHSVFHYFPDQDYACRVF
jgi:ubiquinone/menaquinone biosynthesis C-methylase UbiE